MNIGKCKVCSSELPDTDHWSPYATKLEGFTDIKTYVCDKCGNEVAVMTDKRITKDIFDKLVKAIK